MKIHPITSAVVFGYWLLAIPAPAQESDPGTAISDFFSGLAGNATWAGKVSFTKMSEDGDLYPLNVPVTVTVHSRGSDRWSMGAMICQAQQCYFEGDEIQWNNHSLVVFRYDGNTMPATLLEATPTTLAYEFTDPFGGAPTHTVVHEEIRGNRLIRHTLIQNDGKIFEDYIFSVTR